MPYSTDQYRGNEKAAYELYVQKRRLDSDDVHDWFQAEAEKMIREELSSMTGEGKPVRKTAVSKSKVPK
jgi:hypothetical protein